MATNLHARRSVAALALVILGSAAAHGQTPSDKRQTEALNLSAYVELLRGDIRSEKAAIIVEVMGFNETEDRAFWPIYREYDAEMAKLGDERVALISEYAQHYDSLTDPIADRLATKALDLEAKRQGVKRQYFDRIKAALPARTALRFLQVEQQLLLLIDLQISAALPVAPPTAAAARR
jgi:hypothetical protein